MRQGAGGWSIDAALIEKAREFARRCGARGADAEDLAQEALLKLVINGSAVEDPLAWLFVVVRRLNHRRLRRATRPLPRGSSSFDPWPGIELSLDAERLLGRVSARSRASVRLSYAGFTERESAERLGVSLESTEKCLHRARQKLRAMLAAG